MPLIDRKSVLFVCTHNSARSQLAEALLRGIFGDFYQVFSAGTSPTSLNIFVKSILAEMGYDWSKYKSKHVDNFLDQDINIIATVCDSAKEVCPFFPGAKKYLHKSFRDPNTFTGTNDEILESVRRIKDEISDWIKQEFDPSK